MEVFELRSPLTAEERAEKRKLIVRDSVALLSLFLITVVLAVFTYFLFGSFTRHRDVLTRRWRASGERALKNGNPNEAVEDLHAALEYAPDNRDIEIELATALAAANRDLEATAYFNSLLESQPGNGQIHLQLARLAAKDGNATMAEEHYQSALDGTWEGDGYLRRLAVRLELAGYLINRKDYVKARTELLTASGNASNAAQTQLTIAGMMEQAQDPLDAVVIYRAQMERRNAPLEAFEGAGRTAFALDRFTDARDALTRAVAHPDFAAKSNAERQTIHQMLADSDRILALSPDPNLSVRERAGRIENNAKIARARLAYCFANTSAAGELADLQSQWQQVPANVTVRALEQDPQLEQTTMHLVYDTEEQTAQLCGAPAGDDALLLKLAQAAQAVQQQ
jgi:tetratricopeptide (TPR) repeat protein